MRRIAVIDKSRCINGHGCDFLCGRLCPVNREGAECIYIDPKDNKPVIDEKLCTGCGICPNRCPTQCITILNLPEKLAEEPIARYGINSFELFKLPIPKQGMVVGILGRNGIGKSTALNILAGTLKPNLGNFSNQPKESEIISKYSKSYLGDYFKKLFAGKVKLSYKPQRIELLKNVYKGKVKDLLSKVDEKKMADQYLSELGALHLKERNISELSGGELQKIAIVAAASKKADVYFFDEPASFLDITTRIKAARLIRSLANPNTSVMVVEHDLATLDYISDEIQVLFGEAGVYGIVSQSKSVRNGINEYLDGYLTGENMRFRDYAMKFFPINTERVLSKKVFFEYHSMEKSYKDFKLMVTPGNVRRGEVLAVMGANGLGKSTFLKLLAHEVSPDIGSVEKRKISYKVQYPEADIGGTVREYLEKIAGDKMGSGWYRQNILEKLGLQKLLDNYISMLSGGELQKLHIAACLSRDCDIYAIDEPSAFIDVEDRLKVAEVIKEFVIKNDVCAIVVDHDVQFIDYIADSMLVFEGEPGKNGHVIGPLGKREGMNNVLKMLDITYRMDRQTSRPRINKPGSQLDKQQRSSGEYYYALTK